MRMLPVIGLSEEATQENPWGLTDDEGLSALVLRIRSAGNNGWVRHVLARQGESVAMGEEMSRVANSVYEAANKGQRKDKLGLRAAESSAKVWVRKAKERVEQVVREEVDGDRENRAVAEHLFTIERCNLYGREVEDSIDTRVRLLHPIPQYTPGDDAEWKESGEKMYLPTLRPKDPREMQPFIALAIRTLHRGLGTLEESWGELKKKGEVASDLEPLPYAEDGEVLVGLHVLISRWIRGVAEESERRLSGAEEAADDFLLEPPASGEGAGEG